MGIVFQSFHLIPTMTALENVAIPLELAGIADAESRANEVLVQVTAHAGDHKTAGSVNLFAHVSGGRRIPRLAVLVDSVALTLEAGESHAVSFSVPFERLMDEADDNVRVTFALTAALNNDDTRHTDDCDTSVSIVIHR